MTRELKVPLGPRVSRKTNSSPIHRHNSVHSLNGTDARSTTVATKQADTETTNTQSTDTHKEGGIQEFSVVVSIPREVLSTNKGLHTNLGGTPVIALRDTPHNNTPTDRIPPEQAKQTPATAISRVIPL